MQCFLCNANNVTRGKECERCDALLPEFSRLERVGITDKTHDNKLELDHKPFVPLWAPKGTAEKMINSTAVEVDVHGVKVLLAIDERGTVKVSATSIAMGGEVVSSKLDVKVTQE